jgi:hypothetical protein
MEKSVALQYKDSKKIEKWMNFARILGAVRIAL